MLPSVEMEANMLHLLFPLGLLFQLKADFKVLKKDNFSIG